MRKILIVLGFMVLGAVNLTAATQGVTLSYVSGFHQTFNEVKDRMIQDNTKQNYSCGPTSLLFINNHYASQNSGICPAYTESVESVKDALGRLYAYIGQSDNTITSLDNLKNITRNRWGWDNVVRVSANNTIKQNADNLINYLKNDKLALVVLNPDFKYNKTGEEHIVIVYAYQKQKDSNGVSASSNDNNRENDRIYFYDPYYGGNGYFKRSEISSATNISGFAYLVVAP